ncbi:MAG: 7-cyano-7-deazaguanine synthase QueC [Chthoniobacterales bacterium]
MTTEAQPAKSAVVLLSGGLDSAVTLALAQAQGFETHALSFDYGQRHRIELEAAQRVSASMKVRDHRVAKIDLRVFGGSALTDDIAVPHERSADEMTHGIPITYVPARNTIFLSYALGWAEVLGAENIFIGVNAVDYSGYPDCRPEFLRAFQHLASVATKAGVGGHSLQIHAPLLALSKAEIIRQGTDLGVDFALTHSCYDPSADGAACGSCDSCQLRLKGFRDAGLSDPIKYQ